MARPHPSRSGSSRDSLHQRSSGGPGQPFNHSRRSWTDNGVHYTMETASYSSPGVSFSLNGGSANGLLSSFIAPEQPPQRRAAPAMGGVGGGLLGTAFNLLGAMSDLRDANRAQRSSGRQSGRQVEIEEPDEYSDRDDDLAYGGNAGQGSSNRRRSMFSRLKERLTDNRPRPQPASHNRETSPERRPRTTRQDSYRTELREPSDSEPESDSDIQDFDVRDHRPRAQRMDSDYVDTLRALEQTVGYFQTQVRRSRRNLEHASRRRNIDIGYVQDLVNEVKVNERSLATAEANLRTHKDRPPGHNSQRQPPPRTQPQPRRYTTAPVTDDFDEFFAGTGIFPGQSRAARSFFVEPDGFHSNDPFAHLFGGLHSPFTPFGTASFFDADLNRFFAMPSSATFTSSSTKRPRFTATGSGGQPRAGPSFATFTPSAPPKPPSTLMKPEEAKRLFTMYNERWNALSHSDSNIPYPGRGLQASALLARDMLWAPNVDSHPSTWSEETVMQANVQAFFVNVVGLVPQYAEAAGIGRIEMGYDKARATPAQVKQLIEILKKEKGRWHSDRLGRRNDGQPGANETLQTDERARAVFHAVCELMETAQ